MKVLSKSPYGDSFEVDVDPEREVARLDAFVAKGARPVVVIQGLGFVGSAMLAGVSRARGSDGAPCFDVIGVDLATEQHLWKIERANRGESPVVSADESMDEAYRQAAAAGNMTATWSEHAYTLADIVVIDVHLDVLERGDGGQPALEPFEAAVRAVGSGIREDTLVVVETTVPPGATERIVAPILRHAMAERGLDPSRLHVAHSYERVMPGAGYLSSVVSYYRVFAGLDDASSERTEAFLSAFIDTESYPLSRMHSATASEMAKVLENSYRAANIALIQEWTEFAESAGVDLFQVLGAIRLRKTHKNIMSPGLGVGGYCLTKDAMLADWSAQTLYGSDTGLRMSLDALRINKVMPDHTFARVREAAGELTGRRVTILGVSYLNDVADTRFSPSERLARRCLKAGALLNLHDPYVSYWSEMERDVPTSLASLEGMEHDVVIAAVRHAQYRDASAEELAALLPGMRLMVDSNDVLSVAQADGLRARGVEVIGIGKGHWKGELTREQ